MKRLGFGIIGCGLIASSHVEAIMSIRDAELVAVADANKEKARRLGQKHGVDWYTDYHKMLRHEDINVVNICTPNDLHGEMAIASAKEHKHVIVEKPMETSLKKADKMISVCRESGVKLSVVFQSRFLPAIVRLKKALDEGKFGRIVLADLYNKWYRSEQYYLNGDWRGKRDGGGGGSLMTQAIHGIDLLQYLIGPVESVFAYTGTLTRDIEVEDTAVASLKFRNGALGVIEATTSIYPSLPRRLEIHGEKGTVQVEDYDIVRWEFKDEQSKEAKTEKRKEKRTLKKTTGIPVMDKGVLVGPIEDMIKAVREDRDPLVNGEEGRKSLEIVLALYESARSGRPVKLSLLELDGLNLESS